MKSNQIFSFVVISTLVVIVCYAFTTRSINGEGDVVTKKYDLNDFESIELEFNADVYFTQAEETSIEVKTNQNLFEHLKIEKNGKKLILGTAEGVNLKSRDGINIYISAPILTALTVDGSGTIHINKSLTTDHLTCAINGSGDILANDIHATKTDFEISGSGEIAIKKWTGTSYDIEINGSGEVDLNAGSSEKGSVEISGSGDVNTSGVDCQDAKVEIHGSGDVQLCALNSLEVDVAGSGDVQYKGSPKLNLDIAGSGDVTKMR